MGRFREALNDDDGDGAGIDMSPLIDCVFILLIFFIVTTVFVEEAGVEVDKPAAASASQLEKTSLLIALTSKGEVFHGGKNIGIGSVRGLVKRELAEDKIPVIVQADQAAPAGLLVQIIDEAKLGGAQKVSVATKAQGS